MFPALAPYNWFYRMGVGYPQLWIILLFWVFVFGSCLGSFLNVCIWRIPRGESLSQAASHCGSCNTPIKWYDNLPLISYIVLGGKCRSCKQHYSMRYFIVELICAVLFTAAVLSAGLHQFSRAYILLSWIAIFYAVGISWIDAEYRLIPDKMSYSCAIAGLLTVGFFPEVWGEQTLWYEALWCSFLSGAIPALFLAAFAIAGKIITKKEVLGWGDVKYILTAGILTGFTGAFFSLFFASFTGTIYGAGMAAILKKPFSRIKIPLGPFLAAGTLIWIFAGKFICDMIKF